MNDYIIVKQNQPSQEEKKHQFLCEKTHGETIIFCEFDRMKQNQKHIRLQNFDYSSPNSYFITITTKNRIKHFGEIRNGIMGLSEIGNTAAYYLQRIPELRPQVELDEFIVMPDHIHCILELANQRSPNKMRNQFGRPIVNSVSMIINRYKGAVKKWCDDNNFCFFEWQERFHDHVIRNAEDYWSIKKYIINNPRTWWKKHHRS